MKRFGPAVRKKRQKAAPVDPFFIEDDEQREAREREEQLDNSLADLNLDLRTVNILEGIGVLTLRDLVEKSKEELLSVKNLGSQTLKECRTKLDTLGIKHPDWD